MNSRTIATLASLPAMLAVSLSAVSLTAPPARAVSLVAPDMSPADSHGLPAGRAASVLASAGSSIESGIATEAIPWSERRIGEERAEREREVLITRDPRYVERGGVLSSDCGTIYAVDGGKATNRVIARNEAGWDYTDWAFVDRMKAHAVETGSDTDWFISVDVDAPVRLVLFHRENGEWVPVGGWYCTTGRKYKSSGLPREAGGAWRIENKWLPDTGAESAGPGYCLDFIASYPDGILPSQGGRNDSAAFHCGVGVGEWGYNNRSCISVTFERTRWMYGNIPVGTGIYINGRCGGILDEELEDAEIHTSGINDPFVR